MCVCVISLHMTRVSGPMLNPVPKSIHFVDYLNFGALLIFSFGQLLELVQLSIGYMLVNIELPNLNKLKIFWWSNHGTMGGEH